MDCGSALVVDADAGFRQGVVRRLLRIGYTVDEAGTGEEALAAARRRRPDIVILDVKLPETSGYEVCRALREQYGDDIGIIFVSGERTEAFDRVAGLLIGADDYIVKPLDADELAARVRKLVTRNRGGAPAAVIRNGYGLTKREREVLALLARGLPQQEIGRTLVISPKTVSTHIQHILTKLGVHSRAEAVAMAHRERLADVSVAAAGPR